MYYHQGQSKWATGMISNSNLSGPSKKQAKSLSPRLRKKNLETIQELSLTLSIMMKRPVEVPISETLTWMRKKWMKSIKSRRLLRNTWSLTTVHTSQYLKATTRLRKKLTSKNWLRPRNLREGINGIERGGQLGRAVGHSLAIHQLRMMVQMRS